MGEVGTAYAGCRARIADLVAELDDAHAKTDVPTCPLWTVHDVVAHVAGVVGDVQAGRIDGIASDPWTAAQVEARRGCTIREMLDEWNEHAEWFEDLLDGIGDPGRQAVADVVSHEHDIRAALRRPGARDTDAVQITLRFMAPGFVAWNRARGVDVSVRTTDGLVFGARETAVSLTGDPFELVRAMTGRRSVEQLRAMRWNGEPEPVIPGFVFGPFRPAAQPIDE